MSGYTQQAAALPALSVPAARTGSPDGPGRQARRLELRGTVQGVGLRPFVCRLARQLGIDGTVRNVGGQLVVDAAGTPEAMAALLRRLVTEAPAPAHVADVSVTDLNGSAPAVGSGFRIMESPLTTAQLNTSHFPPDLPTCAACMRELFDPDDRRYRYPFTNCSACGPRATIIEDLPYDRMRTTMAAFEMCDECAREY
ncbi:MAG TPA: acylphosphatase, partial [Actinopolymorphaceae bacterium]|nr:acylphosphatase [Actinopolymorphaceae bacterium]